MLHASASSTAQTLMWRSLARARPSLRWGERVGEAGPAADFQEHFGERDTIGQHPGGGRAEDGQLFGLIESLEFAEVGSVVAGDLGHLECEVVVEALGGLSVGAVQLSAELLERSLWRGVEAQPGADLRPRCVPCGSLEQLRARVGETAGAGNEHVASVQRCLERLQHAEGVCAPVDLVLPELRVGKHESAPPAADDLQRHRRGADASRAALQRPQRLHRLENRLSSGRGLERDGLEQDWHEASEALVAAQQLLAERGVLSVLQIGLRGEAVHRVGGELQLAAEDAGGDRAPQLLDASGRRVEQDEHGCPQRAGGSVEFRELLVAAVLVFAVAWESSRSVTWSSGISASSVASSSSCYKAASRVAVLRCGLKRRSVCAFALKPYRASARSRPGGTSTVGSPTPTARIDASLSKASATSFAVNLRGPARSSSQRESCSPSGTSNSSSKRGPRCAVSAPESDRYSRAAARSRAAVTARASTLAPGNNTFPSIRRACREIEHHARALRGRPRPRVKPPK
jgi:hypothetical protein